MSERKVERAGDVYLSLDKFIQVLYRFGLNRSSARTEHGEKTNTSRTLSNTVFISWIATSVFWTKSSSAFSTSILAPSCFAGPADFKLLIDRLVGQDDPEDLKDARLFRGIEFKSRGADGLAGLDRDRYIR